MGFFSGLIKAAEAVIFNGGSLKDFQAFNRHKQLEGLMAQIIVAALRKYEQRRISEADNSWSDQYVDSDCVVKVQNGYDRDHLCFVTSLLIIPRKDNPRGSHQHVVIDPGGNELFNQWIEK